jgi:hypothetical protein
MYYVRLKDRISIQPAAGKLLAEWELTLLLNDTVG